MVAEDKAATDGIVRRNDNSIDQEHYEALAHTLRAKAATRMVCALPGLLRALVPVRRNSQPGSGARASLSG